MRICAQTLPLLALMATSPLPGGIVGTTGNIQIVSPPASILPNVFESDSFVRLFTERTNFILPQAASVDVTSPGTYNGTGPLTPGSVPIGSMVNSYYLIFDPVGTTGGASFSGTVTFDAPILGIAGLDTALNNTDFAGAPGTIYPTGVGGRAFDFALGTVSGDELTLSADRRTITISGGAGPAQDELRVFVSAVPEPSTVFLCLAGLILIYYAAARPSPRPR